MTTSQTHSQAATGQTADAALQALDPDLIRRLAALARAPQPAAELAISLLPYGYRAVMEAYDMITTTSPAASKGAPVEPDDPRQRVHLTPLGKTVIEVCAGAEVSEETSEELDRRIEALQECYSAELPFTTAEAKE